MPDAMAAASETGGLASHHTYIYFADKPRHNNRAASRYTARGEGDCDCVCSTTVDEDEDEDEDEGVYRALLLDLRMNLIFGRGASRKEGEYSVDEIDIIGE